MAVLSPKAACVFTLLVVLVCCFTVPSRADDLSSQVIQFTKPALALGLGVCLMSSDKQGMERAARASDAVLGSVAIARFLKERSGSSCPSGHSAAAFAMASSLAKVHPKQKWLYYAGAALIGWSVTQPGGGHEWGDVVAGAALGISVGNMSMTSKNGIFLGRVYKF